MSPSWWKNRTLSHFSKPNFDMPWPNCWKSYKVNGYPQLFIFLLVHKNMYSQSPLCARSLTPVLAEIWFFKSLDRGCRTKGPLPNLGRLTVVTSCFRQVSWCFILCLPMVIKLLETDHKKYASLTVLYHISDYEFPEMKICGLVPNYYINVSVSALYIPRIGLPLWLQQNRQTDPGNI